MSKILIIKCCAKALLLNCSVFVMWCNFSNIWRQRLYIAFIRNKYWKEHINHRSGRKNIKGSHRVSRIWRRFSSSFVTLFSHQKNKGQYSVRKANDTHRSPKKWWHSFKTWAHIYSFNAFISDMFTIWWHKGIKTNWF